MMKKKWLHALILSCLITVLCTATAFAFTLEKDGMRTDTITAFNMKTGTADIDEDTPVWSIYNTYHQDEQYRDKQGTSSSASTGYTGNLYPITVPGKGALYFRMLPDQCGFSGTTTFRLCKDTTLNTSVGEKTFYSVSDFNSDYYREFSFDVPASGTYYLLVLTRNDYSRPESTYASLAFHTYFYSSANKTMTKSTWCAAAPNKNQDTRYYKMVISESSNVSISTNMTMKFDLCNSSKEVKYSGLYFSDKNSHKVHLYLPKGTYYIRTNYYTADPYRLKFTPYKVSGSTFQLKNKESLTVRPACADSAVYIKYAATSNGYVTLKAKDDSAAYVTLLNSKRDTSLSPKERIYGNSTTSNKLIFGVKKGNTYYFKVTGSTNYTNKFYLTQTAVSDKSGSSRDKAKSMEKKTTYKGTIIAGSSTADYYKFKLSSSANAQVVVKANTNANEKFKVTMLDSKGKSLYSKSISGGSEITIYNTSGKLPKGTYYVKLQRASSKSSGYYTVKWLTK